MKKLVDKNYQVILNNLKEKIRIARQNAALSVNYELLRVYWEIGKAILQQQKEEGWGAKIIDRLSADLKSEFHDFQGISVRNLKYMRAFAEAYPDLLIVQQPAAQIKASKLPKKKSTKIVQEPLALIENKSDKAIVQHPAALIPWTHHQVILDKVKDHEERLYYIRESASNGWSRDMLKIQIETNLYKRQGKAITNFEMTLPKPQSDLAQQALKNPYYFDFLSIGPEMQERDLERALIQHVKRFLLELGRGFAYVGNQYNIPVDGDDYYLDLLFYNTRLHSYFVFELKIGDFKPEFAGKLNFYVNAVNEKIKSEKDNPTLGVLLCKTPNTTIVKYSLQGIQTPIGVAEYELANALPDQFKGEIATIQELENELEQEAKNLQRPLDKKVSRIKELMHELKGPEVSVNRTAESCKEVYHKVFIPVKKNIINELHKEIIPLFNHFETSISLDSQSYRSEEDIIKALDEHKHFTEFRLDVNLRGFKRAGTDAFNCFHSLTFSLREFQYCIGLEHHAQNAILAKLYNQALKPKERDVIVEKFCESIADNISQQLESITKKK